MLAYAVVTDSMGRMVTLTCLGVTLQEGMTWASTRLEASSRQQMHLTGLTGKKSAGR